MYIATTLVHRNEADDSASPCLLQLSADAQHILRHVNLDHLSEQDAAAVRNVNARAGFGGMLRTPWAVAVGPDGAAYVAMAGADESYNNLEVRVCGSQRKPRRMRKLACV